MPRPKKEATRDQLDRFIAGVLEWIDTHDGLTDVRIYDRGGPANTTMTKVRNGELATPLPKTLEKFDDGLGWKKGSAYALLWRGEQPTARDGSSSGSGIVITLDSEQRDSLLGALRNIRESTDHLVKILGG